MLTLSELQGLLGPSVSACVLHYARNAAIFVVLGAEQEGELLEPTHLCSSSSDGAYLAVTSASSPKI